MGGNPAFVSRTRCKSSAKKSTANDVRSQRVGISGRTRASIQHGLETRTTWSFQGSAL